MTTEPPTTDPLTTDPLTTEPSRSGIEPSDSEYAEIGGTLLTRVRRRRRIGRGLQFAAVGVSAAAVTAVVMTAGVGWQQVGGGSGLDSSAGSGDTARRYSAACYATADPAALSVAVERGAASRDVSATEQALVDCALVWQAGLLDGQHAQVAQQNAQLGPESVQSLSADVPPLQACAAPEGRTAVLPDPERLGERLCAGFDEEEE